MKEIDFKYREGIVFMEILEEILFERLFIGSDPRHFPQNVYNKNSLLKVYML